MVDPLDAVTPLDGRYADATADLRPHASEAALVRERVRVEVTHLLALADHPEVPLGLDADERTALRALYEDFEHADAARVKRLETEGIGDRPPTRHDVKAVEYHVRDHAPERARPWVHLGLTSEDVNNLARRRLVRGAVREVLRPAVVAVRDRLTELAHRSRDVVFPARTHGQPASPTTYGKEVAVFATRLGRVLGELREADAALVGKLGGATGTHAAGTTALPGVDWPALAEEVVAELGFDYVPVTTQVNPGDDLARVFDALDRVAGVCIDCTRDHWQYVADGLLAQADADGVGSSTMPHKVNPIDFENAEGNLAKASADLDFLADYLVTSRLQRDLSDSTVHRSVSGTLGHLLLGVRRLADGLEGVTVDEAAAREAVEAHPAVLAEAVQTALRTAGHEDAYERVRAATQGRAVTLADLRAIVRDADLPGPLAERLLALEPTDYVGLAPELADLAGGGDRSETGPDG